MPPPAEGLASRLFLGPALRTQPDRRLVTLVREGYETAFEEIVRRYAKPLGRYAASIVGGRADDVLQDAFAKALPALCRDDAEIDLRPWLFRIVRNTALNDLRDSPPPPAVLAEAIAGGRDPAEELECREELADLMMRLQALPEAQRAAIVMRELEGLSHEEIAAALGLSGGAARQAIYRARRALRDAAGLLLPLPLLRLLVDHGAETAGAGGAVAVAGASMGGAVKLGVVTAVLAGSVGAGVAVQERRGDQGVRAETPVARSDSTSEVPPSPTEPALAAVAPTEKAGSSGDGGASGPGNGHGKAGGSGNDSEDRNNRFDGEREGKPALSSRDASHHQGQRHGGNPGGRRSHPPGRQDGGLGSGRHDGEPGSGRRSQGGGGGHSGPSGGGPHGGHGEQLSGPSGGEDDSRVRPSSGGGGGHPPPPPPEEEASAEGGGSGESGGTSGSDRDHERSGRKVE